jgi:putative endonuclease
MTDPRHVRGEAAEALAAAYLEEQGLRILERNYRCRMGEIDLVATDRGTVVFVEVRLRRNDRFGGAAASITSAKQARLTAAAGRYLARAGRHLPCRFDAVLLDRLDPSRIEWLRNIITA